MSALAQLLMWAAIAIAIFAGAYFAGRFHLSHRELRIRRRIGSALHPRRRRP